MIIVILIIAVSTFVKRRLDKSLHDQVLDDIAHGKYGPANRDSRTQNRLCATIPPVILHHHLCFSLFRFN